MNIGLAYVLLVRLLSIQQCETGPVAISRFTEKATYKRSARASVISVGAAYSSSARLGRSAKPQQQQQQQRQTSREYRLCRRRGRHL